MPVIREEASLDPVALEEDPRVTRVPAQNSVRGAQLLEHAERDVREVSDRGRQTASGTGYRFPSSASKATSAAPIRPASSPSSASTIRSVSSAGWMASARPNPRGLEHEIAGCRTEPAADDDDVRIEDVDERADRSAEQPADLGERCHRARIAGPRPLHQNRRI